MTTGATADPRLAGIVRAYLTEDDYHRAGALVRAHPELLGAAAANALGRTAKQGPRTVRRPAAQHLRFLDRLRNLEGPGAGPTRSAVTAPAGRRPHGADRSMEAYADA